MTGKLTVALCSNYRDPPNKQALQIACSNKCMYCESKIPHVYWGDVEHIKPKCHFPHLEFVWENLGYVCAKCNGSKADKWSNETPFVNPFEEDPDQHLVALGSHIFHRNGSERGEYTWRELSLNRPDLIERRQERIKALRDLVDKIARTQDIALATLITAELQHEINADKEYAMVCRTAFKLLTQA